MAFEKLLDEYAARRARALAGGGADKYARRKKAGVLNARERIAALVDEGSFIESGLFGASGVYPEQEAETQTDGKLAGFARIDGRDVAVVVNDFTVKGASTSATNGKKVGHMKRTATERGMPLVIVGESTGARLPDAMGARGMGLLLGNDNTQFRRTRETPLATAVVGPSFGSSAWLACLADFAVMQKGATMAVSSPRLIEMALGEKVDLEELGGWRMHAEITGLIDQVVDTEEEMFGAIKRFLSYLPSHHREAPPDAPVPAGSGADMRDVFSILPEKRTQVYDMKRVIRALVDKDTLFELKPRFGKSATVGLARLGGKSVGIVANNPLHRGGALDADACRKIVDFLVLCDSFNIPIVMLVDTPGFQIGTEDVLVLNDGFHRRHGDEQHDAVGVGRHCILRIRNDRHFGWRSGADGGFEDVHPVDLQTGIAFARRTDGAKHDFLAWRGIEVFPVVFREPEVAEWRRRSAGESHD